MKVMMMMMTMKSQRLIQRLSLDLFLNLPFFLVLAICLYNADDAVLSVLGA